MLFILNFFEVNNELLPTGSFQEVKKCLLVLADKFENLQSGRSCLLFSMRKSKRVCVSVLQASDGYHVF